MSTRKVAKKTLLEKDHSFDYTLIRFIQFHGSSLVDSQILK